MNPIPPSQVFLLIVSSLVFLSIGLYQKFVSTKNLETAIDNGIMDGRLGQQDTKTSHVIAVSNLTSNIWFDSNIIAVLNAFVILFQMGDHFFALSGIIPAFCWLTVRSWNRERPSLENLLIYSAVSTIPAQISYFLFVSQHFDDTFDNLTGRLFWYVIVFIISMSILLFSPLIYDKLKKSKRYHIR